MKLATATLTTPGCGARNAKTAWTVRAALREAAFPVAVRLALCLGLAAAGDARAEGHEEGWTYTLRPGDNIWDLSRGLLKDPGLWDELQALNGVERPKELQPGYRLRIPFEWLKAEQAPTTARAVTGEAHVQRAGASRREPLAEGDALHAGDRVTTGPTGSVSLVFADGSTLLLQANGELALDRLRLVGDKVIVDTKARLEEGRALIRVDPERRGNSVFELETRPASTAVRGTSFRAGLLDGAKAVAVETVEGAVAVGALGSEVDLRQGFGTRVEEGEAPTTPVPLLPALEVDGLPRLLNRLPLRIKVPPVQGAEAYRVELALDEGFGAVVASRTSPGPVVPLGDVPDGEYFAAARGVSPEGIEGLDAAWSLTIDARPVPPLLIDPRQDERLREGTPTLRFADKAGVAGYRVQLCEEARGFEAPLVDVSIDKAELPLAEALGRELEPGRYSYRVAAIDGDGRGPFSSPAAFEVVSPPPAAAVEAVDFRDGALVVRAGQALEGQELQLQVASDRNFISIKRDLSGEAEEFTLKGLYPRAYWLRLRYVEADGYAGQWSAPQRVVVPPPSLWNLLLPGGLLLLLLL